MLRRSFVLTPLLLHRPAAGQDILVRNRQELEDAIRGATPGHTILMADGEWPDADIRFEAEGQWGRPITLRAQTPGQVLLTGASRIRLAGRFLVVDGLCFRHGSYPGDVISFRTSSTRLASFCRVTRCAIIDYNVPDAARDTKWVSLYGYRNRVDRCYFAGKTNLGATFVVWLPVSGEPNFHWIERNHFGSRPPLGVNGGETIRVGDSGTSMSSSGTLVESNYFEACNGELEIVSNKSCDNVYRSNTFENCEGTLTLRHGNRCLVEANFFIGNHRARTGGVRVIGEDHCVLNNYFEGLTGATTRAAISLMNGIPESPLSGYFQVKRALVAFNLTVECAQPLAIGLAGSSDATLAPSASVIANNLFSGNRSPLIHLADARSEILWAANLFDGADPGLDGRQTVDAALVRSDSGLWQPQPASPAVAAALHELPDVNDDILGRPRLHPSDIGCFQTSDLPPRRSRLSAHDTGPDWLPR